MKQRYCYLLHATPDGNSPVVRMTVYVWTGFWMSIMGYKIYIPKWEIRVPRCLWGMVLRGCYPLHEY